LHRSGLVKLLIVEADEAFRRQLSERLKLDDCLVFEVPTESEAIKRVQSIDLDVVLLGLKGSGQRGISLLNAIKNTRPLTEVILLSPLDEFSLSVSIEAMKLGAFDDLLVPFDMETLIRRVRAAYQQKKKKLEAWERESCQEMAWQP